MSVTSSALYPVCVCVLRVTLEKLVGWGDKKRPPSVTVCDAVSGQFLFFEWGKRPGWWLTPNSFHTRRPVLETPLSCLESHQGSFFPRLPRVVGNSRFWAIQESASPQKFGPLSLLKQVVWRDFFLRSPAWIFLVKLWSLQIFLFLLSRLPTPKNIIPTCLSPPKKSQKDGQFVIGENCLIFFFRAPDDLRSWESAGNESEHHWKNGQHYYLSLPPGNFCCRQNMTFTAASRGERRKQRCEKNYQKCHLFFLV